MDAGNTDYLALLTNAYTEAESMFNISKQAASSIDLYMNSDKR